jgi:hypothetical protein
MDLKKLKKVLTLMPKTVLLGQGLQKKLKNVLKRQGPGRLVSFDKCIISNNEQMQSCGLDFRHIILCFT